MKAIGKQTKINIAANQILKKEFTELGITKCEVGLSKCMANFALSFSHLHKRVWYYDCPELLSDIQQVVLAYASCHAQMEVSEQLTEEVFKRLRK